MRNPSCRTAGHTWVGSVGKRNHLPVAGKGVTDAPLVSYLSTSIQHRLQSLWHHGRRVASSGVLICRQWTKSVLRPQTRLTSLEKLFKVPFCSYLFCRHWLERQRGREEQICLNGYALLNGSAGWRSTSLTVSEFSGQDIVGIWETTQYHQFLVVGNFLKLTTPHP